MFGGKTEIILTALAPIVGDKPVRAVPSRAGFRGAAIKGVAAGVMKAGLGVCLVLALLLPGCVALDDDTDYGRRKRGHDRDYPESRHGPRYGDYQESRHGSRYEPAASGHEYDGRAYRSGRDDGRDRDRSERSARPQRSKDERKRDEAGRRGDSVRQDAGRGRR